MYPEHVSGLLVPCNGGDALVMSYSDDDGTYGIINAAGATATLAGDDYTNVANTPVGIVNHQIWADMRLRYMNYDRGQQSVSIQRGGIITIPYVEIYGASGETALIETAIRSAYK